MHAPTSHPTELSRVRSVTVDAEFETKPVTAFLTGRGGPASGVDAALLGADCEAPPEILRFHSEGRSGDYYHALSTAAAMRLRLLGTLHLRRELAGPAPRESTLARLAAQQHQAWRQLHWLMAEMRRLDAESAD